MTKFRNKNRIFSPNAWNISRYNLNFSTPLSDPTSQHHVRTPTSQHHGRTPTYNHGRTPTYNHGRTPPSTVCLNARQPNCLPAWSKVNSQLTLFQNLQILRIITSGIWHHSHSSLIFYRGFMMTIVIVRSFAHERKLYPIPCSWTKSRIVQSSTKLNHKI